MNLRSLAASAAALMLAAGVSLAAGAVEMTEADITTRPGIKSSECTVFGLELGMTKDSVLKLLNEKNLLWGYYNGYLLTEKKFTDIVYVFDRTEQQAVGGALFRVNFDGESKASAITLYPAMAKHLPGGSSRLVDQDVLQPSARKALLGEPSEVESEELPIIDLKLDIFHYTQRGFQIRHKHSYSKRTDEVYFSLVPPRAP